MRYACIISNKINGRLKNYTLDSFETEGTHSVKQQGNFFLILATLYTYMYTHQSLQTLEFDYNTFMMYKCHDSYFLKLKYI